jgi:hypothetical protein
VAVLVQLATSHTYVLVTTYLALPVFRSGFIYVSQDREATANVVGTQSSKKGKKYEEVYEEKEKIIINNTSWRAA